ncbi:hypothetical protein AN958_09813 [Leucoagaricus sp. SymC.cos]|nr:hypothetical protein AN958_09813 [Leucoagaricus sp. SymC.cos]
MPTSKSRAKKSGRKKAKTVAKAGRVSRDPTRSRHDEQPDDGNTAPQQVAARAIADADPELGVQPASAPLPSTLSTTRVIDVDNHTQSLKGSGPEDKPQVKELLRINTSEPLKKRPGRLDFPNTGSVLAPFPSALATARVIDDLGRVQYPKGISSPDPELNANVKDGKFRYDRDFLLQFMAICKEKPDSLLPPGAIGLEPIDQASLAIHHISSSRTAPTQSTSQERLAEMNEDGAEKIKDDLEVSMLRTAESGADECTFFRAAVADMATKWIFPCFAALEAQPQWWKLAFLPRTKPTEAETYQPQREQQD